MPPGYAHTKYTIPHTGRHAVNIFFLAMKKILTTVLLSLGGAVVASAITLPSILELRHSITDDNIIAPESFETQTRLLEENFYLKNYVVPGVDLGNSSQ